MDYAGIEENKHRVVRCTSFLRKTLNIFHIKKLNFKKYAL